MDIIEEELKESRGWEYKQLKLEVKKLKNEGKRFEEDFKNSIPGWCWCYRLKDSAGAWQGGTNTRFTARNICDFMIMSKDILWLLELKSTKNASLPFSMIRENQIKQLSKIKHPNIKAVFVVNFRKTEETFIVSAANLKSFMVNTQRKSIPIAWFREHAKLIGQEKKITRYKYKLEEAFE